MDGAFTARVTRAYDAGAVLFREGEQGGEMFVVQSGRVRITKRAGGEERPIAVLGRGEFIGEMAILNGMPRSATATVLEASRFLVVDARTLESMIVNNPEIAMRLLKKLARRLDTTDELIKILFSPDPKARVMLGLKRHAEAFGEVTEAGVRIHVTPMDLAAEVDIAEEDVHEVLGRLRRLRIVSDGDDGAMLVSDVDRLLDFLAFVEMPRRFEGPT